MRLTYEDIQYLLLTAQALGVVIGLILVTWLIVG